MLYLDKYSISLMHNNLAEGWNGCDRFYGIFLLVSAKTWYDANGNLVYVYTSRTKKDGMADEKIAERKLKWDEENRLLASDDNGFVTNYWYDADGERTVKTSGESDQVYVNLEFAGGRTNTAKFSLYVSPYLVANQGGRYTKYI